MIELNKYGLEACTNDKYENLFFNIINYDTMGDHPIENQAIIDKWIKFIPTVEMSFVTEATLPNLYFLIEKIKTFCTDTLCNEYIRLYWRGELKNFYQISDNVQFDILDPYYVYALYDVYFKFHMALLYYNLRAIVERLNNKSKLDLYSDTTTFFKDENGLESFNIDDHVLPTKFTQNFKTCVKDICYKNMYYGSFDMSNPPDACKYVENMIKQLGIHMVFKFPSNNIELLSEDEKSLYPRAREKLIIERLNKELTKYKDNRTKAIILITEARLEYEKFMKLYNYINFDGWS